MKVKKNKTQYEILKSIRKKMPKPSKVIDIKKYDRNSWKKDIDIH